MVSTQTIRRGATGVILALLVAATVVSARTSASGTTPPSLCVTAPASIAPSATKILTIGDSLTSAASGDFTWRYFLWKHLVTSAGANPTPPSPAAYDFVGPYQKLVDPVSLARDNTDYRCSFDEDNGAIPGSFLAQYLDSTAGPSTVIKDMVTTSGSDVLLVFAGVNDLTRVRSGSLTTLTAAQLLAKAEALAAQAQAANPSEKIVFLTAPAAGGTAPAGSTLAKIRDYNTRLLANAASWSTATSHVVAVSTAQNWGGQDVSYDTIHPNPQGEIDIASDVADALHSLGVGPAAVRPVPNLSAYVGPRDPAVLAQPGIAGSNVTLTWTLPLGSTKTMVEREDLTTVTGWTAISTTNGGVGLDSCTGTKPYTCTYVDSTYNGDVVRYRLISAKGTAVTPGYQYSTTVTSNEVTVPDGATLPPLTAVTGISASAGVHAINVHWNPVPGAAGYVVSLTPTGGSAILKQVNGEATNATTVSGLVAGRPYAIRIAAGRPGDPGPTTNGPTVKPNAYSLARPKLTLKKSHRRFTVSWPAVAHATSYEVQYRAPGSHTWKRVQYSTSRSWLSFKTKRGSKYSVRVRGYDSYVAGGFSATATYTAH